MVPKAAPKSRLKMSNHAADRSAAQADFDGDIDLAIRAVIGCARIVVHGRDQSHPFRCFRPLSEFSPLCSTSQWRMHSHLSAGVGSLGFRQ